MSDKTDVTLMEVTQAVRAIEFGASRTTQRSHPQPPSRHDLRLWRLPLDIRLQIYDHIATSADPPEYIRDHCACQYDEKNRFDRAAYLACGCRFQEESWLDSAFADVTTPRHDAYSFIALLAALPILWPDTRVLRGFYFESPIPVEPLWSTEDKASSTRAFLRSITRLLQATQSQKTPAHIAMDWRMWQKKDACTLLDLIVKADFRLKLIVRLEWCAYGHWWSRELQKKLKETAKVLKSRGGGLRIYVENHLCCDFDYEPLPLPSDDMEIKLVGRYAECQFCM